MGDIGVHSGANVYRVTNLIYGQLHKLGKIWFSKHGLSDQSSWFGFGNKIGGWWGGGTVGVQFSQYQYMNLFFNESRQHAERYIMVSPQNQEIHQMPKAVNKFMNFLWPSFNSWNVKLFMNFLHSYCTAGISWNASEVNFLIPWIDCNIIIYICTYIQYERAHMIYLSESTVQCA